MSRVNRMARPRRSYDRTSIILLVAFFLIACVAMVVAFTWARSFFTSWAMTNLPGAPKLPGQEQGVNPGVGPRVTMDANVPLQPDTGPTPVPWDGSSRITILLMGMDYRDWAEGTDVPRTDTMILFTIDPLSKTAGMLSIPRDLWVTIPGMENNKINTAYRWGEIYKLPGGGPGLAMKTVENVLGVPIHYYALVDFNAFVKFIDSMGGLDMHIREEITVDPIGPGNTVTLEPGVQTLDGATALAYARMRYTANDDFDRSSRQQEVILAIRNQVLTFNMLPTLISNAPMLYHEISSGIRTNLNLDQVIRLAWLAMDIREENIKKGIIGPPNQVEFATSDDGQSILIPVPDQIRILRDEIFATGGPVAPAAAANAVEEEEEEEVDLAALIKEENARLLLKNGTNTEGLASKTGVLLRAQGFNVIGEENADEAASHTIIKDYTGNPYTIRYLIETLGVENSRVENAFDPNADMDLEVILGEDWASQQ